jgi:2-polyprenyl-6-methoxyphenol hydroxylase-like FAD-dependent oxidoreductase
VGSARRFACANKASRSRFFEQAEGIRELGVGLNLMPHAVKELAELGLLDRLDATGVRILRGQ